MAKIIFCNNATSTLAGGIVSSATTANLSAGTGALFSPAPSAGEFIVATFTDAATGNINEIVHITNVSGDTVTIVRGQEGTAAANWAAGDIVTAMVTAGSLQALDQATNTPGKLLGLEVFSTAGSHTPTVPAGCNTVIAELQGAGGSGGAVAATGAGVGNVGHSAGAGAYIRASVVVASIGAVVVGTGGAAPVAGANNGVNGSSTTLNGTVVVAPGGVGGLTGTPSAGPILVGSDGHSAAPTVGAGATLIDSTVGPTGNAGLILSPTAVGSGFGAPSHFGPGGEVAIAGAGGDGLAPGAGGSGAGVPENHAAAAGGAGKDGYAILWYYS